MRFSWLHHSTNPFRAHTRSLCLDYREFISSLVERNILFQAPIAWQGDPFYQEKNRIVSELGPFLAVLVIFAPNERQEDDKSSQ